MITVILIHGTFARGAAWADRARSEFCTLLSRLLGPGFDIRFETFTWSGWNFHFSRLAAADRLAAELTTRMGSLPDTFVVAHSHGGNALMYALGKLGEQARQLGGAIFLATPFIRLRWRKNAISTVFWVEHAFKGFFTLAFAFGTCLVPLYVLGNEAGGPYVYTTFYAALTLAIFVLAPLIWWKTGVGWLAERLKWTFPLITGVILGLVFLKFAGRLIDFLSNYIPSMVANGAILLIALVGFIGILLCLAATDRADIPSPSIPRIVLAAQRAAIEHKTPLLRYGKCYFVRPDGDEAASLLSALTLLSNLCVRILDIPRRATDYFNPEIYFASRDHPLRNSPDFRRTWRFTTASLAAFLIPFFILALVPIALRNYTPIADPNGYLSWVNSALWFFSQENAIGREKIWSWLIVGLYFFAGFIVVPLLVLWIVNAAIALAFGTTNLAAMLLLQHSVEPLPEGDWMIKQGNEQPNLADSETKNGWIDSEPLAHSNYNDPSTVKTIADWIRSRPPV